MTYYPILKAKQGELGALEMLKPETKKLITPILEIPGRTWDYKSNQFAKTIDEHLKDFPKKVLKAVDGIDLIIIDSPNIEGDLLMEDGSIHYLEDIYKRLDEKEIDFVPCTGFNRNTTEKSVVKERLKEADSGLCLRLNTSDLESMSDLDTMLNRELDYFEIAGSKVYLVLDFRALGDLPSGLIIPVLSNIIQKLPDYESWKQVIVSGTSFPVNLGGVSKNSDSLIPRTEWQLWNGINEEWQLNGFAYSDYGPSHPDLPDIDPRIMKMSASIRYSTDSHFLIKKGESIKRSGTQQFNTLCGSLVKMPEFKGKEYSWGDEFIYLCSEKSKGPGNATTWRKVATNHHIELVVNQLSSLS